MPPVRHIAAIGLIAQLGLACSDDPEPQTAKLSSVSTDDPARDVGVRVEAFVAAPRWDGLVELLGAGHEQARSLLGPHRLRYTAQLTTGPANLGPDDPLAYVAVGEPIHERFTVTDQLELRWGSQVGEPPRLYLEQHNEHEHGRALIVIDEQEWSQLDGRGWLARPLETDLWQLWADDAQHAVLDLVELAGPFADIDAVEVTEVDGRAAVRVSLRAATGHHAERTRATLTDWREHANVEIGAASIILDRATGLWLAAQIELRWVFADEAGRKLTGLARFDGRVEIPARAPEIAPPSQFAPVPERERLELLRDRMLDGLAGP